jgi:hypothetical protein
MKLLQYALLATILASAVSSSAGDRVAVLGDLIPGAKTGEPTEAPAPRVIPKSWGRLVSVNAQGQLTYFYFEATDGTIRRAAASQLDGILVERGTWVRK